MVKASVEALHASQPKPVLYGAVRIPCQLQQEQGIDGPGEVVVRPAVQAATGVGEGTMRVVSGVQRPGAERHDGSGAQALEGFRQHLPQSRTQLRTPHLRD